MATAIKNYFGKKKSEKIDPLAMSHIDTNDNFEVIKEPFKKQQPSMINAHAIGDRNLTAILNPILKTENELVQRLKICTKKIDSVDFNYQQFFTTEHDKYLFDNNIPCYFKFSAIGNLLCSCDNNEHLLLVYTIRTNSDAFNTNLYSIMKSTEDVYRNEYTGLTLDYYKVKKMLNGEVFLMLCVDDIVQLDKSCMPKVNSTIDNLITYMDTFTLQQKRYISVYDMNVLNYFIYVALNYTIDNNDY